MLKELLVILKELKINPPSGYGETIIVWQGNEVVSVEVRNKQLAKNI